MSKEIKRYEEMTKCPVCGGSITYVEKKKIFGKSQKYLDIVGNFKALSSYLTRTFLAL